MNIYFIHSPQKSGTHLIANIIENSYDVSLYKNDCSPSVMSLYEDFYQFKVFNRNNPTLELLGTDIRLIKNLKDYKCIVFSAENSNAIHFINNHLENFKKELDKIVDDYNLFIIQNIRDPRNILASSIKFSLFKKNHIKNIMMSQYSFLEQYNKTDYPFLILTNYNKIIEDGAYLKDISSKLNLNYDFSKKALDYVQCYGNGSSFDGPNKVEIEYYKNRYINFIDNELYKELHDEEHLNLYQKY